MSNVKSADVAAMDLAGLLPVTVPLGTLGVLIGELLGLLQQCFPDPSPDGLSKRTEALREPPYGIAGIYRYMWRRRVNNAVAQCWKGDPKLLPTVQDAVLEKLRRGVSLPIVTRLYAERT